MSERFDKFFDLLMSLEGKYSDYKNDKGGKTMWGISENILLACNKIYKRNYQIKTLTKTQAKEIYKNEFFDKVKKYDSEVVHYHYFDICVNSGYQSYAACRLVCNDKLDRIVEWRMRKYNGIVTNDPTQKEFYDGWINRLKKIDIFFKKKDLC